MKNNIYLKLLVLAVAGQAQVTNTEIHNQFIPGQNGSLSAGETALLGGLEPGPVRFNTLKSNKGFLGTNSSTYTPKQFDTASDLNEKSMLGTNSSTYTPKQFDTPSDLKRKVMLGANSSTYTPQWVNDLSNLKESLNQSSNNEVKKDNEITDEDSLEFIASLFEENPKVFEEEALDKSVSGYFDNLSNQLKGLNRELEEILSPDKMNELSEKYPLLIDKHEVGELALAKNISDYPDLMHNHLSYKAPDLGEIKNINDVF